MDSRDNFIEHFRSRLAEIDETRLISLANRGIYKRSLKDLDGGTLPEIEIGDDSIKAKFEDDVVALFSKEFEDATCSCPSKKYCRHRILSLLYFSRHEDEIFGESTATEEKVFDKSPFLSIPIVEITEKITEKELETILFRFQFGIELDVKEQNRLIISFPGENCVTSFSADNPFDESSCSSCKDEEFCVHRAEALIQYLFLNEKLSYEQLKEQENYSNIDAPLKQIKSLLTDMIELGLARLPQSIINSIEQEAIICKNHQIPEIESKLRTIQKMIGDYLNGSVTFSAADLRNRISSLYNRIGAIQKGSITSRKARSTYGQIPPLTLQGVGAEKWSSASYAGVTYYFYSPRLQKWFTFSQSRPTYYDNENVESGFNSISFGEQFFTSTQFSGSGIRFRNLKVNNDYRISSSQETKASIYKESSPAEEVPVFTSWQKLFGEMREWFCSEVDERSPNGNLAIITPASFGTLELDELTQRYKMELTDCAENVIEIDVQHRENRKMLISNLKTLVHKNSPGLSLFGRISLYNSRLQFFPITLIGEETTNLTMEELS